MLLSRIAAFLSPAELASVRAQLPRPGTRVVLGMSGGVDSSVSALLLKAHGVDVTGVWMNNWNADGPSCEKDFVDACAVAASLDIECHRVDLSKDYWMRVWAPCLDEFAKLKTPNPDVLCNREIKFGAFARLVRERFNASVVATGHYAQLSPAKRLQRAADLNKDQTFFLCMVRCFSDVCFPVGALTKPRVRALARYVGLHSNVYTKPESAGVCFVGKQKKRFGAFLQDFIENQPAVFVDADTGERVSAAASGMLDYTIGQRARIPGGSEPCYVLDRDPVNGIITVAKGATHPRLFTDRLVLDQVFFSRPVSEFESSKALRVMAQTGNRLRGSPSQLTLLDGGSRAVIEFDSKVRRIDNGQVVALYSPDNVECWGGGTLVESA